MGKQATAHPSEFWLRLVKAWGKQGLPTSQNGVAKRLLREGKPMSQGSTGRWFRGDGYPEIPQLIQIARLGKCSIHWLLTNEGPESLAMDADTTTLLRHWANLSPAGRTAILRAAWLEDSMTYTGEGQDTASFQKPVHVKPKK